jgi:hypothetical protein
MKSGKESEYKRIVVRVRSEPATREKGNDGVMQKHDECSGESSEVYRYPAPHCVGGNLITLRTQQEEFRILKQFTSTGRESQAWNGEEYHRVS